MSGRFVNVGDEAKTGFGGDSYWVFKAITLNEPQFIELECVKSHMIMDSLDDPEEWLGTRIRFEISEHLGRSEIIFTHLGLHSQLQCFDVCSGGWDHYILDSLSAYLHDEGGKPNSY
ncbi:MAG: hypothetical protein QNJ69_03575 [Gammaproteobacteria bacterium]|nr:hypothetical protein [Gammaproteobacteria bacterium]